MCTPARAATPVDADVAVLGQVLVGIDETPESLVAVAQAGILRAPGGRLMLLAVSESHLAAYAGLGALRAADDLDAGTLAELAYARELVDADDDRLTSGDLVERLCSECVARDATLIAVGVRSRRRLSVLTFGGHDIDALHNASCSVLIARPGWGPHKPERIVVGVDGTPASRAAEAVARSLAARLECEALPVVALGETVRPEVLREEREDALLDTRTMVEAVVDASSRRSLIVVAPEPAADGRRRRRAVERLVYAARCSVLVVRYEAVASG